MTINSIEIVVYTAYFLLPGYIINEIIRTIVPEKRLLDAEKVLRSIGYSIFELAVWYWLFNIIKANIYGNLYWLVLIIIVLFTSVVLGITIGLIRKFNPIRKLLLKLKISAEHIIPTAWDYKFSELQEGRKLTVALNDGTFIRGVFYNKSMASSDDNYRDIFLEQVYVLDENNIWKIVEDTDGVWIAPNIIKWISFMEDKENATE